MSQWHSLQVRPFHRGLLAIQGLLSLPDKKTTEQSVCESRSHGELLHCMIIKYSHSAGTHFSLYVLPLVASRVRNTAMFKANGMHMFIICFIWTHICVVIGLLSIFKYTIIFFMTTYFTSLVHYFQNLLPNTVWSSENLEISATVSNEDLNVCEYILAIWMSSSTWVTPN